MLLHRGMLNGRAWKQGSIGIGIDDYFKKEGLL